MMFKDISAFFAIVALAAAVPASVDINPEGFPVIAQEGFENGVLTWYGFDAISTPEIRRDAIPIEKRCGSNVVTCDGANIPNASNCRSLFDIIRGRSGQNLPQSPRSVCFNSCCVSWHNPASNARYENLLSAGEKSLNQCVNGGSSAKARDVLLGSTCTDQCLSNRATNC